MGPMRIQRPRRGSQGPAGEHREAMLELLEADEVVILGQPHGPAILEGPEISDRRLEGRARLSMPVVDGNLDGRLVFLRDQTAGVEPQEVEIVGDNGETPLSPTISTSCGSTPAV